MTNKVLFEEAIRANGLTIGYVAEKLGLSRVAFYKKRNNETEFKVSEIVTISRLLKLNRKQRDDIFFASEFD